ncbi:MAG: hypothetical protein ACKV2T_32425 [Kofleriaceae bacterium]
MMAYDPISGQIVLARNGGTSTVAWNGSWRSIGFAPAGNAPSLVFDSVRERLLALAEPFDQLQVWDGNAWSSTSITRPQPQLMAFSVPTVATEPDGELILLGDTQSGGSTWRLDRALAQWQQLPLGPTELPDGLYENAITSTPWGVTTFGGGPTTGGGITSDRLWTLNQSAWLDVTPTGQRPLGRKLTTLIYDSNTGRLLLFGGAVGLTLLDETWEWDRTAWKRIFTRSPSARSRHAMAYDSIRRYALLFGGVGDETWSYRYTANVASEACAWGRDLDGDGLIGCADPDCWGICTPLCPPNSICDPSASRCGDQRCDRPREDARLCSECGPLSIVCGDHFCDAPETSLTCPGDCP